MKSKVRPESVPELKALKVPRMQITKTKYLIDKYFDKPKKLPSFIYDYTNDLQLVKPYTVKIKTNISAKARKMTVYDFLMATSKLTVPNCIKSQFVAKYLESGNVLIDGKVMPGNKLMTNKKCIISKRHRHETPIPLIDIVALKPLNKFQSNIIIDKPAGLPCTANMIDYAYNSLPFMLYMHKIEERVLYLHNDIGLCSGIVLFSTSNQKATSLLALNQAGKIKYTYLIRVYGRFDKTITNIKIGCTLSEKQNNASIEVLDYNANNNTSLLKLYCYQHSLYDIQYSLSDLSHTIVNDWKHLRLHNAKISNSLDVQFGQVFNDLFHNRMLIQDAKEPGGYTMRNCLELQKKDYIIKLQHLKLSTDLKRFYSEYNSAVDRQEHFNSCAECHVTRLPYPINLMYPQIHLQSITQGEKCLESKQQIEWL